MSEVTPFVQECMKDRKVEVCEDNCLIECVCDFIKNYGVQWEAVPTFGTEAWFAVLTFLSFIGYSVVALAIYYNKSLQVHPMNLIFYTSIADAILVMNLFQSYHVCDLHEY